MREREARVGRADHNPAGAQASASGADQSTEDRSGDSADQHTHGAHGKRGAEETLNEDSQIEPAVSDGEEPRGTASWGSEGSGGSVVDRRPKD
jgi:hypothetical protein